MPGQLGADFHLGPLFERGLVLLLADFDRRRVRNVKNSHFAVLARDEEELLRRRRGQGAELQVVEPRRSRQRVVD